jgi:hypothetical protein
MLAKGETIVGAVFGLFWECPLFLFFAARCAANPNWHDVAAAALSVPVFWALAMLGAQWAKRTQMRRILDYYESYPSARLSKCDISSVVTTGDVDDLLNGLARASKPLPTDEQRDEFCRDIYLVKCPAPPLPNQVKCYPVLGQSPYIFLRDDPKDLTDFGKFKLFHELGHAHPAGGILSARVKVGILSIIASSVIVLTSGHFTIPVWLCGGLLGVWAALRRFGDVSRGTANQEVIADVWAIRRLNGRIDLSEVVRKRRRQLEKAMQAHANGALLKHALRVLDIVERHVRAGGVLPEVLVTVGSMRALLASTIIIAVLGWHSVSLEDRPSSGLQALATTGFALPVGWLFAVRSAASRMYERVWQETRRRTDWG